MAPGMIDSTPLCFSSPDSASGLKRSNVMRESSIGADEGIIPILQSLSAGTARLKAQVDLLSTQQAIDARRYNNANRVYKNEISFLQSQLEQGENELVSLKSKADNAENALSCLLYLLHTHAGLFHLAHTQGKRLHAKVITMETAQTRLLRMVSCFSERHMQLENKCRLGRYTEQELREETEKLGEALAEKTDEQLEAQLELMNQLSRVKKLYDDTIISGICREIVLEIALDALGCAYRRKTT